MLVPEMRKPVLDIPYERNENPGESQTEAADLSVCGLVPLLAAETRTHRHVGYKNSVSRFHMLTMSKCDELSNELQEKTYKPQRGEKHEVFEPKYRVTVSSKYRDRVPQSSFVTNCFYPNVIPHLIENNCACVKGRGVDMAREKFKEILRNADMTDWCAATDMTGYFASIRHDSLYGEVGMYIHGWADWFYHVTVENSSSPVGLDLGSEVYQLSATALPNRLDHILDDGGYIRYQDDLRYVGTKEKCLWMLDMVRAEAERLGLTVSEKKTYIQPIKRPVRFLGFTFLRKPTGRVTMKRLPEKLRHERRKLRKMYRKGIPQDRIALHWQSARECIKKGTRGDLHKMDKYVKGLKDNAGNHQTEL